MQTAVLLSIKPEFVERIFDGTKRYEFRRALFKRPDITKIVIYASSPIRKVVGEIRIGNILKMTPSCLWKKTKEYSGIDKERFDLYFSGKEHGYAIEIVKAKRYKEARTLIDEYDLKYPPQSFAYVTLRPKELADLDITRPRSPVLF